MEIVKVNSSVKYEVRIGSGLLASAGAQIKEIHPCKKAFIVSDDNVFGFYGEALTKSLADAGYEVGNYVFPHGEQHKNIGTYAAILNEMCLFKMSRGDIVVALGGGIVGDMAGFAAATYQRGIPFVQVPTSLLAAVDSSVGGKTGIDLENGKNQVGAFYQPLLVLCDIDTLNTLPEEEYRNGCAEIIKYAMIGSAELFEEIEKTPVKEQYEHVVAKCVSMKRDYVEQDEHDLGLRMMLNFGHTFGHAVETCSKYGIAHGAGVAIGMTAIARASVKKGLIDGETRDRLIALIEKYGLPTETDFPVEDLAAAAVTDKKRSGDKMHLIVPTCLGTCVIRDIHKDEVMDWMRAGDLK